jgi:primosomal protein N'
MDGKLQTVTKALTPKNILSSLECPVCMEYSIGIKIFACLKGHTVCGKCQPFLDKCPKCRGPPAQTRNLGLENIAESVVVQCPFAEAGCIQYIVGTEYNLHESKCDFR